jgi:hypothetical protein
MVNKPIISGIWYNNSSLFRVYGGIGEVGRVTQRAFCDGLEEGRFADISQSDLLCMKVSAHMNIFG